MKKTLILFLVILCISKTSFAGLEPNITRGSSGLLHKFGIAPGIASNLYMASTPFVAYGINLRLTFNATKRTMFGFGYIYSFPVSTFGTSTAYSTSSMNSGFGSVPVIATSQINFNEVYVMGLFHFVGQNDTKFSFYGTVGASLVLAIETVTYGPVPTGYSLNRTSSDNGIYTGATINGALGLQFKIGLGYLFAESRLAFPANKVNNTIIENPIPLSFGGLVGYKIPFGH
jgi:hypothetical protein